MFVRIYTGADGQSHFEDLKLPPPAAPNTVPLTPASGITIRTLPLDFEGDWHHAGRVPAYGVFLSGVFEVEVGDGAKRRFKAGDMVLGEDTTGQGHRTRSVGKEPVTVVRVELV